MDDFSKVKVGDKLWSAEAGWTTVTEINSVAVIVTTIDGGKEFFCHEGRLYDCPEYPQSLFFEEMILVSKPKPEEIKPFDPNKPYQRRDGKACKILHTTKEGRLVVLAIEADYVFYCYGNGKYIMSAEHPADLINIPEKIEGWMNIYKNNKVYTYKAAADIVGYGRIACKFISFTEGEGLND